MTTLYSPTRYTGTFATVSQIGDIIRLAAWQFGRAIGHRDFETAAEAVATAISLGLSEAGERMQSIFEQDVILAAR